MNMLRPSIKYHISYCQYIKHNQQRLFHSSRTSFQQQKKKGYFEQISDAWNNTEVKWYPIPVGLGLAVIGVIHYRRVRERELKKLEDSGIQKPKYVASGPWQVHLAASLPLRSMSRLWGVFNSLTIPTPLRPSGFKLYSWLFGCNLDEMKNPNLYDYPNLCTFFYRELKEGVRPISSSLLVSPSDGKILHFGKIESDEKHIEQIKGVTYSLDALLGSDDQSQTPITDAIHTSSATTVVDEEEFANMNGIHYSLDDLIGANHHGGVQTESKIGLDGLAHSSDKNDSNDNQDQMKQVTKENMDDFKQLSKPTINIGDHKVKPGHGLFFCVVYLAPGDYHRFHSPANWVVQTRRHFAGELFSVSPYFVNLLQNLFVLNERVVLLGKWKYGFFSMIPVGATNVGSIKINFDEALKTNNKEDLPMGTYTEVTYRSASKQLGGKPLQYGDEMGGFYLGSTVVLVFEAPLDFKFKIQSGQTIKMGEALGDIEEELEKK
ncbi:unnamed protein product [Cunninghamella blakesleeana]